MQFGSRSDTPFVFVSLCDPRVLALPVEQIEEYEITRNIEVLDLDSLIEQPLKIRCIPMTPDYDKYRARMTDPDVAWHVFAHHVNGIENGPDLCIRPEAAKIREDQRAKIAPDLYAEAAMVIAERTERGGDLPLPHTQLGIWRRLRIQLELRNALSVHIRERAENDSSSS